MPFIKLTKVERKRFLVFISCFICALAAWLFMALNGKYKYIAKTELIYKDEPQNKAFKPLQPDVVDLAVEGTGWQLLFSRLRINPQSITVSLEGLNRRNFILFSEQMDQVNRQLETSQKIIAIKPDTLYFDFSKRTNKRVPIKLTSQLTFVNQYGISSPIILKPAYVNISGPQEELSKISEWATDTLKLSNLQQTTNARIAIRENYSNNISIYPSSVGVVIPVDEFTEKTVEVPLKIINNIDYDDVKLFPKKVQVTFLVALASYQEVDEDFIEAVVDINEWKKLKHSKLTVKINRLPTYCKLIKVFPDKINFIIEK
ncbi:CdaR family protein [Pedobacter cryotolerans]|uniref:YbbR-like domain-containing protein n=1 Tax=Pedobacter cryotolerans TaxID=2571270 RepID=A0A4U1C5T9_9SPHI|nr:YbbR-like domain-containing protein [Pedobacter cryotolerans]TKB99908.1 YbbR-like domain-containing protein [Pedobacter cryotolerans]